MYQNKPDMRLSTCNTTPPTNTTSRAIRLLSTHSSPARQQPLSKMLCSTTPTPPPPTPCQGDWLAHPSANYTTQQSPVSPTDYVSILYQGYYIKHYTTYASQSWYILKQEFKQHRNTAQYMKIYFTFSWLYNLLGAFFAYQT